MEHVELHDKNTVAFHEARLLNRKKKTEYLELTERFNLLKKSDIIVLSEYKNLVKFLTTLKAQIESEELQLAEWTEILRQSSEKTKNMEAYRKALENKLEASLDNVVYVQW